MRSLVSLAAAVALAGGISLGAQSAQATPFGFELLANDGGDPDISDQFLVDVLDTGGGLVSFDFQNLGPDASSITDIYFHDINGDLIDPPLIIDSQSAGVSFSLGASPGNLPAGNNATPAFIATTGLTTDSDPAVQPNGINPGEWLLILANAFVDFDSIIAGLTSGNLRIGLHVQGLLGGGSQSYTQQSDSDPAACGPRAVPQRAGRGRLPRPLQGHAARDCRRLKTAQPRGFRQSPGTPFHPNDCSREGWVMTYQCKWLQVPAFLRLALASAVVAGLVAFATPGHAVTINDDDSDGVTTDIVNVGNFGIGDILISHRTWESGFAGDTIDISYVFTASGDSSSRSTATSLNPNPPAQGNFGIGNLILTWSDGGGILSSQQFTDANGVLNTSLILTQLLTDTKNFTLQLTGTLLNAGGGFIVRVEAIPLPAGLLLFLSGLAGIGFLGRYKARRHEPAVA